MNNIQSITVFCGSSNGNNLIYAEEAIKLGALLATEGIKLIYGGAKVGIMGHVADGVMKNGGSVTGVIPKFLSGKEIAHDNITNLIVVDTMHERKLKMNDLSNGAIALPGGYGTLEELFEMLTWAQLGLHAKPLGILNINDYFDPLVKMIDTMTNEGFLKNIHNKMLIVESDPQVLLNKMHNYQAPEVPKWLSPETT